MQIPLTQRHHHDARSINTAAMSSGPTPVSAPAPARLSIAPAKLLSSRSHTVPGSLRVTELLFQVPLDHAAPDATITLFGRLVAKHETPVFAPDAASAPKPLMVYLEGGPGFGNAQPQDHPLTRTALGRGYEVLFLDHRGVGLSTPVSAEMLRRVSPDEGEQADYLKLMRQDSTVRDCEAVRKCLTRDWPEEKAKWSIFGQSYGGFVSLSYLSMHPEGLREVFLTGGLAPVKRKPEEVYQATFRKVAERNAAYYKKFPEDVKTVHEIASYIRSQGGEVPLPAGGSLTVPRLLTIGISFGGHGGFDSVHNVLLHLKTSLDQFGFFTRAALAPLESHTPFDTNIIYAILHEAIYCDGPGVSSSWAAQRVGETLDDFPWLRSAEVENEQEPLLFSGEMIFPFHFATYPELQPLRAVAEKLARFDQWPALYDQAQLARNEVPVYAASFIDDMYVDNQLARETAQLVRGTKVFETNVMYHSALRNKTDEVLHNLFSLRDDVID